MTPDIDKLEAVAKAATPGPWAKYKLWEGNRKEDYDLQLACDPPTILALCALVRTLQAENARLRGEKGKP